ncbi:MAG: chorismate mutase [Clostridia bacterium]|nr:chorismate mutase [Clostridia bacterium]
MKELSQIRLELDAIDQKIVALFEERMLLSRQVAQYKIAKGLPVLDSQREKQVIQNRRALLKDPHWADGVEAVFETIMAQSRKEQEALVREAANP